MKIMRFIILLVAVAYSQTCDNPDGVGGTAVTDSVCDNGFKLKVDQTGACDGVDTCTNANCCETGAAGDDPSTLKGGVCPSTLIWKEDDTCVASQDGCGVGYTLNAASATAICAGLQKTDFQDANSDITTDTVLTVGAAGVTVTCTVPGYAQGGTNASYDVTLGTDGTTLTPATGCEAVACVAGADAGQAKGITCQNSGTVAGTGISCSCDCDSVWFSGTNCETAATIRADAGSDKTTATTVTSAAAETFTCSGTKLAALTGAAAGGTGGAASYTVSQDAAGVNTYTPLAGTAGTADVTCQEPITLYLWTGGDANSDLSGDQNLAGTAQTVTCDAGFAAGVKGAYVATYDITLTADDTFTTSPLNASCAAKVFDIPAQDIANTNFAAYDPTDADTDAIEITFEAGATPTGVAITCNTGYFGTDGKLVVDANGGVTEGTAASCTQCTADGASNTIPTANAVPANATGTAASWTCTQADASYFGAFTCNTGYTANAANTACEADATDAPTTTAAPVSSADDESAASPAFIAGTAIAGIALLL